MMHFLKETSMTISLTPLRLSALVLALLAGPALAIEEVSDVPSPAKAAAASAAQHGTVQKGSTETTLRVNSRAYVISGATVVYGAGGMRVAAPRLVEGQTVAFNLAPGSLQQIKELWIVQ